MIISAFLRMKINICKIYHRINNNVGIFYLTICEIYLYKKTPLKLSGALFCITKYYSWLNALACFFASSALLATLTKMVCDTSGCRLILTW